MSGTFRVSDQTIETAARAACIEADWTWTPQIEEHIPSPVEAMTPIVTAALTAALPSLVAEIREQIAQELMAYRDSVERPLAARSVFTAAVMAVENGWGAEYRARGGVL